MVFGRKVLREIFGPTYENGSWQIQTNQELDKIIKHKNIIHFARAQRLGWYGHTERMQETRMIEAIHSWKPISKRPKGRPKIRWKDDVKKDTQKFFLPPSMPPHVRMNFRGFPPGCGDSVADF